MSPNRRCQCADQAKTYRRVASRRCASPTTAAGEGPPLVLLHGIGMSKEVWRPVVPLLAREREVIAVDMPGFGASPPGPRTVAGLADAVAAFVALAGDRPPARGGQLARRRRRARARRRRPRALGVRDLADRLRRAAASTPTRAPCSRSRACSRPPRPCSPAPAPRARCRASTSPRRPWRIPREDVLQWGRAYAGAAVVLGAAARRLVGRGPGVPDHDRLGRARPPADLLPPVPARAAAAPGRAARRAARLRARADVGRPRAGRPGAARGPSAVGPAQDPEP